MYSEVARNLLVRTRFEPLLDMQQVRVHQRVCDAAAAWVASQGWAVRGVTPSPITGPEGNVEFLLGAEKIGDSSGSWG